MVEENGRRMRDFTLVAIFSSVDFGYMRTAAETDVRGKIAQSGHGLAHGYSVDGRSG